MEFNMFNNEAEFGMSRQHDTSSSVVESSNMDESKQIEVGNEITIRMDDIDEIDLTEIVEVKEKKEKNDVLFSI